MSTKNIEAALKWARNNQPESKEITVADAIAELEAIRKAARAMSLYGEVDEVEAQEIDDAEELFSVIAKESP